VDGSLLESAGLFGRAEEGRYLYLTLVGFDGTPTQVRVEHDEAKSAGTQQISPQLARHE